jgi:histidine decarboxylase
MIENAKSTARALESRPVVALEPDPVEEELARFLDQVQVRTDHHLGYPYNLDHDYSELLPFLRYTLINLGDPFTDSNCKIDTRKYEKEVLAFFADLFRLEPEEYVGYVTAGGTEGNIYGLYVAAQSLPDAVLYASRDAHYSVFKSCRMLRQPFRLVDSTPTGEMDYASLEREIDPSRPAIVSVTVGTTVKGAIDDPERVLAALEAREVEDYFIHCDGALNGLMLPFIPGAPEIGFDGPIDSLAISGHKFLGTPIPCGVVLLRRHHQLAIETDIEYIGSKDTTILGARCGLAPLLLWYALRRKGRDGLRRDVEDCLRNARYLHRRLRALGYPTLLNPWSNTVWLRRPPDEVVEKWQLAVAGDGGHVVVMQNVDRAKIDEFLSDLRVATG